VVDVVTALCMRGPRGTRSLFVSGPEPERRQFVAAAPGGACVFFEREDGRLCTIHRRAGADALPSACRHFPRIYLRDARGWFLSLSHFCPTAAALLMDDGPLAIVEAGPPLALESGVEGFEAEQALPPLLRPGLLMDLDAYAVWERASIETFARDELTHEQALAVVGAATERARLWKAGGWPLASRVEDSFARIRLLDLALDRHERDALRLDLIDVPPAADGDASWERFVAPVWARFDRPIKRYLAARLFGSRIAYESRGLRSMVEWLRLCLALLRHEAARLAQDAGTMLDRNLFIEAIRASDLLLVHRIDSHSLARRLEPIERQP
jgi:hypothetical protein